MSHRLSAFLSDALAVMASSQGAKTVWATSLTAPLMVQLPEYIPVVAVAGACGGIARWIAESQRLWPTGLGTITLGVMTAVFLWPLGEALTQPVTGSMDLDPFPKMLFGGFVTGLFGVSLIGMLLDLVHSRRKRIQERDNA